MSMLLRPNPSSGIPVYLQLMEQVKGALETGALRPGELLPAAGEEWGEDRLLQLVETSRGLPARELIDCIMRAADDFAGGAAQYDDMTLITARIVGRDGGRLVS